MKRHLKYTVALGLMLASAGTNLSACGINFSLPTFHFPHVTEQGKFSYWEKIGEIDAGGGLTLPIHLNFSPERQSVSPTLNARGFLVGLTDAHAVQLDERRFRVYTPAGRYRTFYRDRKNPNVIHSGKNWKGELKGDVLTVASECGDRLTYHQGVISQMQLKERRFDFIKSGRVVTEIREGGKSILRVTTDPLTGNLKFGFGFDKEINFEFAERPIVQVVAEKNIVGKAERSLHKIFGGNDSAQSFEFAVNEEIKPTIKIGDQEFSWNTENGIIISDGDWKYDVKSSEVASHNAAVGRTNSGGQREFWHYEAAKGQETSKSINGVKTQKSWFTSGRLQGKLRVVVENGTILQKCSYDENGRLKRNNVAGLSPEYFEYGKSGRLVKKIENEKIFLYDLEGRLLNVSQWNREVIRCSYDPVTGLLDGVWSFGKRIF